MEFIKGIFISNPGPAFHFYIPVLVLAVLLIIGSIVFSQIYKKKKKTDFALKRLFRKTANRMLIFGTLFAALMGIRHEAIPYFSMRLWFYITILVFLYWLYKVLYAYKYQYPIEKRNNPTMEKKVETKSYTTHKKRR